MDLNNLFNPKSIAIVGASEEEGKVGNVITKNILSLGYRGDVFLVNPKHENLFARKCYKSLSEIAEPVDLAVLAIPAKFIAPEIEKNAARIKNFVIISAGFSEIGQEGKEREEKIKKIADENQLNILGPNCLGFINPGILLNATFAGGMPIAGNIALISQSGALAVAILDIAEKENLKFASVISVGNKMDIDEAELLDYLGADEKTKVIAMYLEGIRNGQRFLEKAAEISRTKPVVILKAGKTEKAQKAISSHTGALAGSDDITSAAFEKAGIIRVETTDEFFGLLQLLSFSDEMKNENVAVVTNAGGPGVITTDAFKDKKIKLLEISDKTREKLKQILPEESALGNPIDVLGDAHEDRYKTVLGILAKEKNVGAYLVILTPQDQTPVAKIASKVIQFKKKTDAVVAVSFIGGHRVEKAVKKLRQNNIPCFDYPDEAVENLEKYYQWSVRKNDIYSGNVVSINEERKQRVSEIIQKAKGENRGALYFSEAKKVMDLYNVKTSEILEASGVSQFPIVLKVDSDKTLHKTDKGGLVLGIKNKEELDEAIERMKSNFPGERLIIQPELPRKTELILGIKKDAIFGPVVVFGLGGIYTEIFKMADFIIPPISLEEIEKTLKSSKIKFLFEETRGQKPYDIKELAGIISGIAQLATEIEEIREFDINPLLIYNDGKEAVAVDVKIII